MARDIVFWFFYAYSSLMMLCSKCFCTLVRLWFGYLCLFAVFSNVSPKILWFYFILWFILSLD